MDGENVQWKLSCWMKLNCFQDNGFRKLSKNGALQYNTLLANIAVWKRVFAPTLSNFNLHFRLYVSDVWMMINKLKRFLFIFSPSLRRWAKPSFMLYMYVAWRCMLLLMLNILWAIETFLSEKSSTFRTIQHLVQYTLQSYNQKRWWKADFSFSATPSPFPRPPSFSSSLKLNWHHIYDLWIHTISLRA